MNTITFVGNLGREPEMTVTQGGTVRTSLWIAVTENSGRDNERTHWLDVTCFGSLAENVHESLSKGDRVLVQGRVRTWERDATVEGVERTLVMTSITASNIGPDLRFATAEVTRNPRREPPGGGFDDEDEAPKRKRKQAAKKATKKRRPAPADDFDDEGDDGFDDDDAGEEVSKPSRRKKSQPVNDDFDDEDDDFA